jgi:hypothetical protein
MRLDRYIGESTGKYSIIENRNGGRIVNVGDPIDDFFVLKLKDRYSRVALLAYADQAEAGGDVELATDVRKLAESAGTYHPHSKRPD